jgi:hypothetical protein
LQGQFLTFKFKMIRNLYKTAVFGLFLTLVIACQNDDIRPSGLRPSINYSALDTAVAYTDQFLDETGASTASLVEGNTIHKMFQGLNYYNSSSVSANASIDAQKLKDLFTNTGNPFSDISTATISITGADLNNSGISLREHVALSLSATDRDAAIARLESLFDQIAATSAYVGQAASKGVPGKLGNYLVNEDGIEFAQIIQKSLIGALQLDYISNVLLDEGLNADNSKLVAEEKYTELEHNWDVAYGLLTLNPIYLRGATDGNRKTTEFAAGAYIWEYNKTSYAKIYPAFLKGRAAIVNNDKDELLKQALFIRTEFEKALANAAYGYLQKFKNESSEAARAHAIAEGLGFIYSLRFAKVHGADAEFSDHILNDLTDAEFGIWDISLSEISHASDEITEKFNL